MTPPSNLALQNHVIFSLTLTLAISIFTSAPTSKAPQAKPGSQPPRRPSRQHAFPVTTAASQGNKQDEKLEWCSSSRTYYSLFVSCGKKQPLVQSLCFILFQKPFQPVFHVLKLRDLLVRRNVLITLMRGVDGQMDSLVFLPSSE